MYLWQSVVCLWGQWWYLALVRQSSSLFKTPVGRWTRSLYLTDDSLGYLAMIPLVTWLQAGLWFINDMLKSMSLMLWHHEMFSSYIRHLATWQYTWFSPSVHVVPSHLWGEEIWHTLSYFSLLLIQDIMWLRSWNSMHTNAGSGIFLHFVTCIRCHCAWA